MRQTLFFIPETVAGMPLFGVGALLAVWAVASVVFLAWLVRRHGFNQETWSYVPILGIVGAAIWLVLPAISIHGSGLPIRGYGVMMLAGVVAGSGLTLWRGRRLGIDPDFVISLIFWGFIPGILGARMFYVIEYWPEYHKETLGQTIAAVVNITEGGLVVYGSLIGGLLGFTAFVVKNKLPPLATLDLLTPGMLLGLALGRIGCFLNGCCFGGVCELPWSVTFPQSSPPYHHQIEHGDFFLHGLKFVRPSQREPIDSESSDRGQASLARADRGANGSDKVKTPAIVSEVEPGSKAEAAGMKPLQKIVAIDGRKVETAGEARYLLQAADAVATQVEVAVDGVDHPIHWAVAPLPSRSLPVHPTQLYSSIDAFVLFLFIMAYDPFRRRDGELIAILLTLYPINRFLMELIRTDEPGVLGTGLTIGQVVSLLLLALAIALWVFILRRPKGRAFPMSSSPAA
jgi:phosphatidylglycerol:prolipoprotein diacylglycerol transferase